MDINEHQRIQCFNCHCLVSYTNQEESMGVCQACLHSISARISSEQTQYRLQTSHLTAIDQQFLTIYQEYAKFKGNQQSQQALKMQIRDLQLEEMILKREEDKIQEQLRHSMEKFVRLDQELDKQMNEIHLFQSELSSKITEQEGTKSELLSLESKKKNLEKLSLLIELYCIHFEDRTTFINRQPLSHHNSRFLLEIFCHLMKIYHYKGISINLAQNTIKDKTTMTTVTFFSQKSTFCWLSILIKEIKLLWEHIKKEIRRKDGSIQKDYFLPFPIKLEPEVSVGDVRLRQGPQYLQFLRYLSHELKFLISFEFSQRQ